METIKETIYELETSLLTSEVRTSFEKLNQIIADDFIEYGSAGLIYDKKITLEKLPKTKPLNYRLYDFEIFIFSEQVVQTRFKTDRTNADGTQTISLRSSLWKNNNGTWQMFFHQGTNTN